MKLSPKISIITPTLNSMLTIESCLSSVASQTYKNIEHLIIDGASSDGTLEIVKRYQSNFNHIRLVSESDKGIYDAMNKGIDLAKGDWLFFLGSDDTLYNKNIFSSLSEILSDPKLDIIYGNVIGKTSGRKYLGKFSKIKLIFANICHQAILTRKTVFEKFGKFETKYKTSADWLFNMKWFNDKSIKHIYIESNFVFYSESGYSFNNPDLNFSLDFESNVKKYFPKITNIIYKFRNTPFVREVIKILYPYSS